MFELFRSYLAHKNDRSRPGRFRYERTAYDRKSAFARAERFRTTGKTRTSRRVVKKVKHAKFPWRELEGCTGSDVTTGCAPPLTSYALEILFYFFEK